MTAMKFNGKSVDFAEPKVMGVLNVTPDSFYDGGRIKDDRTLLAQAEKMLAEGADFLDVGGFSSRPGADFVSVEEERRRVVPAVKLILKNFPEALPSPPRPPPSRPPPPPPPGAALINDISAGDDDPEMFKALVRLKVSYVAMHKRGTVETMQKNPSYGDVVSEIFEYLRGKVLKLGELGVTNVIIDPGFGFGKTPEHNYALLKNLDRFKTIGAPVLVGLSRKSMIQKAVNAPADDALFGTIVANTVTLIKGADILRVHDVRPAKDAIAVVSRL